jgi:beta-lactamase class A
MTPVPYPAALASPPSDWSEQDAWLGGVAPRAGFQAVEIAGGEARPIHGYQAEETQAIGSAFKLYVLAELARRVAAGDVAWDERLDVRDDLRSLPSGDMRLLPAGVSRSVRAFAETMIADSDNTATDHLIARLGRDQVEATIGDLGHAAPALLRPLLLTREWFAFKLRLRFDDVLNYLASDVDTRRAYLTEVVAPLADDLAEDEATTWTRPRQIDTVEWFASSADLCRVMAALDDLSAEPVLAPLPELLSTMPGVVFDARVWSYVGYKGGYETGVFSHSWLLERGDGRRFAMCAIINDPWQEIDGELLTRLMIPAAALLAAEP